MWHWILRFFKVSYWIWKFQYFFKRKKRNFSIMLAQLKQHQMFSHIPSPHLCADKAALKFSPTCPLLFIPPFHYILPTSSVCPHRLFSPWTGTFLRFLLLPSFLTLSSSCLLRSLTGTQPRGLGGCSRSLRAKPVTAATRASQVQWSNSTWFPFPQTSLIESMRHF